MTIEETHKGFVEQLKKIYEAREAGNIADWVFESAGLKRLDRITDKHRPLSPSITEQLNSKLEQLLNHKPVQYVLNEAWFYKIKFFVDENVLIPRPETEELVSWVVEEVRGRMYDVGKNKNEEIEARTTDIVHILDIGTGSGCIPIALKKELPKVQLISIDVSEGALKVARRNAAVQNTEIQFINVDFLEERSWPLLGSFDIIVSNPPYIPVNEKSKLEKNVTRYEPHLALFVEDNDPFIFYKKIALFAKTHLKENGEIFVEVHEDHAERIKQIFTEENLRAEVRKDIYRKERMIKAYN